MRVFASSLLLILLCSSGALSKTPAQLKTDFKDILPAGKKARCAWLQTGYPAGAGSATDDQTLLIVDSDNGIVKELTPPSLFTAGKRTIDNPSITFDGSRIIFNEAYSNTKYVMNWDGTGLKSIPIEGYLSRYWRDGATGTDWAIIDMYDLKRCNIDNPTQSVQLWTLTEVTRPWFTLSPDGQHMAFAAGGQAVGIGHVPNGQFILADSIGCRINIAPDNSCDFLFQLPYHHTIRICDSLGHKKQDILVTDTIVSWAKRTKSLNSCHLEEEYETVRWTNNRDYITFFMYNTSVNPFIMSLSNRKWMYLADSLDCKQSGNLDMVILDTGAAPSSAPIISALSDFTCLIGNATQRTFAVTANPLSTGSATGLPSGISLIKGTTPAPGFTLSGTPTQKGIYTVVLRAKNTSGTSADTVIITVSDVNAKPSIFAGRDTTTRPDLLFYLNGNARDDGYPNQFLQIRWTLISPLTGATITVPGSINSSVTFADSGMFKFELSVHDGQYTVKDTVAITVSQRIVSMVLFPAAGAWLYADSSYTISWQMDPPALSLVYVSADGGKNYTDLTAGTSLPQTQTSFAWRVPKATKASQQCVIKIASYLNPNAFFTSGAFTIVASTNTIIRPQQRIPLDKEMFRYYSLNGRRLQSSIVTHKRNIQIGIILRINPDASKRTTKTIVIP